MLIVKRTLWWVGIAQDSGCIGAGGLAGEPVAEPKSPSKSRNLSAGWYAPRRSRKAVTGFFAEPPRGHRRARLLHGADGQLPRVVLLVSHRARTAQDCTFPRDRAPELGLGGPATTRSLSRLGPLPILDPGSGYKVRCRSLGALRSIGLKPKRTSRESPRQNGVAERWVGSCAGSVGPYDSTGPNSTCGD